MSFDGGHEKVFRSSPIIATGLDSCLDAARMWLKNTYLRLSPQVGGWAMSDARRDQTVWGGTVDGIRALTALGVPPATRDLRDGLDWIRKQQLRSGGFCSCEIDYVAAESTAWTLIMFGELGIDEDNDHVVKDALRYLRKCIGPTGGVSTTPDDISEPRTMPTALALWTFSLHPNNETVKSRLIEWLRNTQDADSHGWGVALGATPNAATTSQVIHALCTAGVSTELDWMKKAADYVIGRQEVAGNWINGYEEWFTVAKPRTPVRCLNYGPSWGLLALTHFHHADARAACLRAVRYLLEEQDEGSWRYDRSHQIRYIWCVSQCVMALKAWQDSRLRSDTRTVPTITDKAELFIGDWAVTARNWLRSSIVYFLISLILAAEFRNDISRFAEDGISWLSLSRGSITNDIASSLIWAIIVVTAGFFIKCISGRK